MKRGPVVFFLTVAVFSLLLSGVAEADAGVPMLFLTYPAMLLALLPIIGIETAVFERALRLGVRKTGWYVAIANAASTVVGFPLTWLVWMAVEMGVAFGLYKLNLGERLPDLVGRIMAVTVFAPWLGPNEQHLYWMVPTAAVVGLIPAFFVSVWIEGQVLKRLLKTTETGTVQALTWKANLTTYAILIGLAAMWLLYSIVHR